MRTYGDVAVGGLEHLVHALGSERGAEDPRDGLAGGDVGLLRVEAAQARLLLLLPEDDEGAPELVEGERHGRRSLRRLLEGAGSEEEAAAARGEGWREEPSVPDCWCF